MTKVKNSVAWSRCCYSYSDYCLKAIVFSQGLKNKACHYSVIIVQFCDCYIQVKDNEIVDSGSLQGGRVHYV